MGLSEDFVWVLTDLGQKFVLNHACNSTERDEEKGNYCDLPAKEESHRQPNQKSCSNIYETRNSLRDQVSSTLGTGIYGVD